MSVSYVSDARHKAIILSCQGRVCTAIRFSGSGAATFAFDNGVEIEFSDGWCYTHVGREVGHGPIFEEEKGEDV